MTENSIENNFVMKILARNKFIYEEFSSTKKNHIFTKVKMWQNIRTQYSNGTKHKASMSLDSWPLKAGYAIAM